MPKFSITFKNSDESILSNYKTLKFLEVLVGLTT